MIGLNHYTGSLNFIKETAMQDSLVNVVTQGNFEELDIDKMTIRPFVHASVVDANFDNGSTVTMTYEVGAFTDRITQKKTNTDKFWGNTNEVDNLNTTLAILNRMWSKMYMEFDRNDISASENPSIRIFEDLGLKLDGWIITFTLEMPNTTLNLCTT